MSDGERFSATGGFHALPPPGMGHSRSSPSMGNCERYSATGGFQPLPLTSKMRPKSGTFRTMEQRLKEMTDNLSRNRAVMTDNQGTIDWATEIKKKNDETRMHHAETSTDDAESKPPRDSAANARNILSVIDRQSSSTTDPTIEPDDVCGGHRSIEQRFKKVRDNLARNRAVMDDHQETINWKRDQNRKKDERMAAERGQLAEQALEKQKRNSLRLSSESSKVEQAFYPLDRPNPWIDAFRKNQGDAKSMLSTWRESGGGRQSFHMTIQFP